MTPPREEPGRPGVVTAAIVVWIVLGALMVGSALLVALAIVLGSSDQVGALPVIAVMVVLAAGGAAAIIGARRLRSRSRSARVGLTVLGAALAVAGLVQVTFLGVGGAWFVAFVAGAVLLHLPAARDFFAREDVAGGSQ